MNLRKRSNGVWTLCYREGGERKRISTGERDRARAEEVAARIIAGTHEKSGAWDLEAALYDCYERVWSKTKNKEHTFRRIRKLSMEFGAVPLRAIDYAWLVQLGQHMETVWKSKDGTINRYYALISKALGEAELLGKTGPRPRLPYRRESKGKLRWLTPDEESELYAQAFRMWPTPEARRMRALIEFLVDTGARLTEALNAGRRFNRGRVGGRIYNEQVTFEETKNGSTRSVPLTPRALAALHELPDWTAATATGRFTRLRDACGMPDVSLHTLRHTCLSRLVQGGMDLYRVMHWAGHSSISVTQRYAHLAPSSLDSGRDILSRPQPKLRAVN